MESQISDVMVYLVGAAVVGLVAAVAKLWHELNEHKLHVAQEYMANSDVDEIKQEIRALRDVVYRVALRLEIPVFSEPFRK